MPRANTWRASARVPIILMALCAFLGAASAEAQSSSDFMLTFTIRDVMDSIVMPSADVIWNAVAVNVSAEGVTEIAPETDEDWERIRRAAVMLAEATNVLAIPGRPVARPEPDAEVAEGDLSPAEIEALLKTDWPAWTAHLHVLHQTAMETIQAIDARDADAVTEVGGSIDAACESCHVQFWYPDQ